MKSFSDQLISWYRTHKRALPWRETRDIYKVWLSEIILQQTRVDQGLPYYERFLKIFPDVNALAKASREKVLKAWEGLGYYSRARNLHETARTVSYKLRGRFPGDYSGLIRLKGIGPYTAAAIASFCYDEARAVADGNVMRFLSRLHGIRTAVDTAAGRRKVMAHAQEWMKGQRPSEFNQAIMEFGALYCIPASPDCTSCIFRDVCVAGIKKQAHCFPVKKKKTAVRDRYFHYFLCEYSGRILIHERTEKDIWQGLFDLPLIETARPAGAASALSAFLKARKLRSAAVVVSGQPREVIHILSHQKIHCRLFVLQLKKRLVLLPGERLIRSADYRLYPMPRLLTRFLSKEI
ncbi:MAG: A/G-specific adenine glycosylase [Bacteroidia bacterium]|nr:A/G-specific adenine glycosylase [Bacteroidia bacterium]